MRGLSHNLMLALPAAILEWPAVKDETGYLEKDRGRESKRVHAIQDASMARDKVAKVLDPLVPLDRRHDKTTPEPKDANHQAHTGRIKRRKWSDPEYRSSKTSRKQHPSDKPFNGLVRADGGGNPVLAEKLAAYVLRYVTALNNNDKIEKEHGSPVCKAWGT